MAQAPAASSIVPSLFSLPGSAINSIIGVAGSDVTPLIGPAAALFGFYCAINGGRIGATLGCQVQDMLGNNMYVSQAMAFITILFFTSLVTTSPKNMTELINQFYQAIGLYIIYVMTTKVAKESFVILMAMLSVIFILRKFAQLDETKADADKMENIKTISNGLIMAGLVVLIFGFASYTGLKLIEYKDMKNQWSWKKYLIGTPTCARDGNGEAGNATYMDGLKRIIGIKYNPKKPETGQPRY